MACPRRGTQRTHSTPSRDDGVEHRYLHLPRSALRASLGRLKHSRAVSRRKPMAPKGAWQEVALARSNACGARATGLASAPRAALRRPRGRLRRSRAVGGRKPTAPLADCRLWRSRVQTPEAHAQPGWHQRLAALRASLGRLRRSRAVGGRKPAAPKAACQAAAPARSNAAWQWSSAKEPSADARSRARCSARTIVRGRDAPALPCHSACGAHLGPRPPKQPVWRVRTPPRMGEEAPSRRALDHPHQPAARPECPSARPASRPPRHALDQRPAYGRESPARSHGNPMTRAQR